jgi:signal transduction histidine kinase
VSSRKQAAKKAPSMAQAVPAALAAAAAQDAVMSTVFRADGTILLQNPAARVGFAAPEGEETSLFLRHFVSPREAAALLARMARNETIRSELPVHTSSGIRRLRFVASPLHAPDSGEQLFLLVEAAFTPGVPKSDEQTFRDYAEAAADWFWEMDTSLCFSFMSESTQLPAANLVQILVGQRLTDIAARDGDGGDWRSLADLLEARLPFRDIRVRCRDSAGITHDLSFSGLPVADERGQFRGYRGIARDLTLLVRAEKSAAIAQNRLMDAIESIPECFMLLDAEDRLVLCNSRYREVNAAVTERLVAGTPLAEIYRASVERGAVRPASGALDERFKDGRAKVGECQLGERWFQISERRTHDGGSVVVQTEITALKRREQELAEKTALLRATLDNMRQGLFVLDDQFRLKLWNDRICEIFDFPPAVLKVGLPITAAMRVLAENGTYGPGNPDAIVAQRLADMRRAPTSAEELTVKGGRVIECRISPMPDGGVVGTYLDISARKRVEAHLRQAKEEAELASRTKTEFLANISHELRTPLNAIIGFAEILSGQIFGKLGDQRYVNYAADIRDSGQHLLTLINDVLDVSKIEVGKLELNEEPVDIIAVLESSMRLMRDRAEEAGLELRAELPRGLPFLQADARRLKQILLNLMSNAVKFTAAGGRVVVRAVVAEDGLSIAVEDTGIGIAPHDLEKALRPFGQIDSRMARKYQGTGLGLPLTKSMVELHGGRLTLESEVGRGTKATIWLPRERIIRLADAEVGS